MSIFCVVSGLMGANFSVAFLNLMGMRSPIVRGLTAASAGHGLATAAIAMNEPDTLPYCSLAYTLSAITSAVMTNIPLVRNLLILIAG